MDSHSIVMIATLCVLIIMSAYFSATETAFSSLNRIKLKNMASKGNRRATLVLSLADDYDRILSTILIGNNIVNIVSASMATVLFTKHYGDIGLTLSTIVMTVVVLIFGEISPKSLAKETPEKFAMFSAPILKAFVFLLYPFNLLFMGWKGLLSKLFHTTEDVGITEEELITMIEEAEQEGGINSEESELIRSAIGFGELEVIDIYTPRIDVTAINQDLDKASITQLFMESGYSRLPVYKDSVDNIFGIVHQKDFYNYILNSNQPLSTVISPALYTTSHTKLASLIKQFQQTKMHMAVVADEYGGTLGIVTLEDILEELVGEIWDEYDEVINEFEPIGDNHYRVACGARLEDLFELFSVSHESDATTVGGWVMDHLGRIATEEDCFSFQHLQVRVTKIDQQRVLEIEVLAEPVMAMAEK